VLAWSQEDGIQQWRGAKRNAIHKDLCIVRGHHEVDRHQLAPRFFESSLDALAPLAVFCRQKTQTVGKVLCRISMLAELELGLTEKAGDVMRLP
jgi:hypothetical protein